MGDNYGIAGRIIESISAKDAEIETLKKVLETIRAICRGASAAGTPEMGLQTVIDCVNIAIDPGVVEEVSDA